ncbi:LacI family DNA-binding transcriptional regulator [Paenibacillus sp. N3.4]|uniref:LacI family DNA-binding transcriptional regulator n=1 Tax=Paenibacillus sp. N3.4 TaxID=2603222 RepID=UPI0011C97309|nr:LacI family DNA-binding transcriptional regulator [Paenibacillus sp. N3.4]TXK85738.1 LacI family transcriptional regulator [Paenibacillus sp. N3.4]
MSVTIKDIAKLAGVSHTTVSRALNNSPLIQEDTKERIRVLAEQLDYTPNFNAKSLVLDRSYNLGLFFTTLSKGTSAGFFYEAIRGVNSVIQDRYQLIVKGIDDYTHFQSITRKSFDGMIIVSQSDDDQAFIDHAAAKGIPLAVLNRPVDTQGVLNVLSDEEQGAFLAVSYLIEQGHKRIALIEGRSGFKSAQNRKDGFERAMKHFQMNIPPAYRRPGLYDLESGHSAMQQFLALEEVPTAVFCCNDEMALGAMKAITESGRHVPDDISVVGFDDTVFAAYVTPALTTVRRPIEQISREGALRLLGNIENKRTETEQLLLRTELILRESVRSL